MKALCPVCKTEQTVNLIFHAETSYDTELEETITNDVDFSHAECSKCYCWLGDEVKFPDIKPILVKLGWRKFEQ